MLIDLALGTVPSNLTVPRMAVGLELVVDGAPAFTICRLEIEMVRTKAIAASKVLYFILHLDEAYASKVCVSVWRSVIRPGASLELNGWRENRDILLDNRLRTTR